MNLTYSQVKELALGAEFAVETESGLTLYRFNEEELESYTDRVGKKIFASASIRLAFFTDASAMTLGILAEKGGSSRTYFAIEVMADGEPAGVMKNYQEGDSFEQMRDHCSLGAFEQTFLFKEGKKHIEIYLPWSVITTITKLELEGATLLEPAKKEKVLLMYGDSITHGYDAYLPSQSYANRLADFLGMEVYNKAIGGEIFYPPLAQMEPTVAPDLITVAYGTNDWNKCDHATLLENSRLFFEALAERHPDIPIIALAPIWRLNWEQEKPAGDFRAIATHFRTLAEEIPTLRVIDCFDFIPHERALFADLRLHPTDEGFRYYFEGLKKEIL